MDLTNKIVLFKNQGSTNNQTNVEKAASNGAVGAIIYSSRRYISTDNKKYS